MPDDLDLRGPDLDEEPDELDSGNAEEPESDDPLEGDTELQAALLSLYQRCCADDRYPRLIEVKETKQAEFYWAGRQYIWWSDKDQQWSLPTQSTAGNYGDLNMDDMPRFQFVTNIYQARGLMMIGAIAGAPPRQRFFPADPDNDADLETAEGRTKLAKLIERWNPPQKMLQDEAYHAWTGGFICWRTRYMDFEKDGSTSVDLLKASEEQPEATISCPECGWSAPAEQAVPPVPCPQCQRPLTDANISEEEPIPVPEDDGTAEIPKGRQLIEIYGALNCKRPQHAKTQAQYHYFAIEDETHFSTARAEFEDKADKIKAGMNMGSDDIFERNARLSVAENTNMLAQTGADQASLVTRASVWFRPTAFWMLEEDKDAVRSKRDRLLEIFPRGCRVEFCGTTYCKSAAESMDDSIVTAHAMPGRGQHRPGVGSSMISVQDRVNTNSNIEAETYEYGIPITYRASDTFNQEADDDQRAAPGLEVEIYLQPGQDVRQKIYQVRSDSPSPEMTKNSADLMGPVADMLSGTYPALSGAGSDQGAPDTLGQQAMQRDQAMGRLGIFYVNLKQAHADIMTLACRDFEAHATGEVKIPVLAASGDFESEAVDITALEGEAQAYPEGDENFPELWNQKRATIMQIMETPYGEALTEEPENLEFLIKAIGIPELKFPGRDSVRKQLKEIAELTKIPTGDEMNQQMVGIAPMVEVDPETDNHPIEMKTCQSWLNSETGQKVKRNNPPGWLAVKKHMLQHKDAIPPAPAEEKPPNETINFKDMPPEAQAQALEKIGIHVNPQAFLEQVALEQAKKAPKAHPAPFGIGTPAPAQPQPAGNEVPPAAGA